jgi:hypothetical protein
MRVPAGRQPFDYKCDGNQEEREIIEVFAWFRTFFEKLKIF